MKTAYRVAGLSHRACFIQKVLGAVHESDEAPDVHCLLLVVGEADFRQGFLVAVELFKYAIEFVKESLFVEGAIHHKSAGGIERIVEYQVDIGKSARRPCLLRGFPLRLTQLGQKYPQTDQLDEQRHEYE